MSRVYDLIVKSECGAYIRVRRTAVDQWDAISQARKDFPFASVTVDGVVSDKHDIHHRLRTFAQFGWWHCVRTDTTDHVIWAPDGSQALCMEYPILTEANADKVWAYRTHMQVLTTEDDEIILDTTEVVNGELRSAYTVLSNPELVEPYKAAMLLTGAVAVPYGSPVWTPVYDSYQLDLPLVCG